MMVTRSHIYDFMVSEKEGTLLPLKKIKEWLLCISSLNKVTVFKNKVLVGI